MISEPFTRRNWLKQSAGMLLLPPAILNATPAQKRAARLRDVQLLPVRATERTVWLFIRVTTDSGLTGLGEASDAFSFANTSKAQAQQMEAELRGFIALLQGRSPLDIEYYRQQGRARASKSLLQATAFSAVEQALWDLAGKLLQQPVYNLFGGKLRESLPVYANINRVTQPRTPAGFAASAQKAVAEGFRALKLAPFDGFKRQQFEKPETSKPVEEGIACIAAVREAAGNDVQIMVDAHSLFDTPLAINVAERLEPFNLAWYEEPVAPTLTAETVTIKRAIKQPMAGGEMLFGTKGFAPLCREQAVHVIMPDVKHCGGLLELTRIAALAELDGVAVAPHNPSGPVATAASVQVCAGMANFRILELQWGEVAWRRELVSPFETFVQGQIAVPNQPGLGIELNDRLVRKYAL
jgi:galactonate dehydratase